MFNYQIIIEYLGSNYIGWQIEKNGKSIQILTERALKKTLKLKIKINESGRTDTGVHAIAQTANFSSKNKIKNNFKFLNTINYFLKKG